MRSIMDKDGEICEKAEKCGKNAIMRKSAKECGKMLATYFRPPSAGAPSPRGGGPLPLIAMG